ncbi:hypothetical protein BN126360071 [Stenotrophomonas indicatrix]|nr:hypothetical protein BN126360071 [Stenotrophomonas indicatrix]
MRGIVDDSTYEVLSIALGRATSAHGVSRLLDRLALTPDPPQVVCT